MKINRHNYEEFFLLYVDNELQPEERKEVENFVAQNPDLSDELIVLQQTILPEGEIVFTEKNVLYKKEEGISLSNYETFFLLYVDKELTAAQNDEVETFVLQHPQLQNDFTLLKKSFCNWGCCSTNVSPSSFCAAVSSLSTYNRKKVS